MERSMPASFDSVARLEAVAVSLCDLPADVLEWFEGKSELFRPAREYRPGDFSALYRIPYDGGETFVARQVREEVEMAYAYGRKGWTLEFWAEIGNLTAKPPSANSYLYFMGVSESFRRRGIAADRTVLLNAISEFAFGKPLKASNFVTMRTEDGGEVRPMERIFEKLAAEGVVEPYETDTWSLWYAFRRRVCEIMEKDVSNARY